MSERKATAEELAALDIARQMAQAGIPIFVCPPRLDRPGKYFFKADWQNTIADPSALDAWRPGWGVGAVGGVGADFLDVDPRSGGQESAQELKDAGHWPLTFGTAATPSGGTHHVISRTGERKETGFMPGLDFQAGGDDVDEKGSKGRAFVWLAPTVGRSKVTGELVPYRWIDTPDLEALDEWRAPGGGSSDASTEHIVARVHAHRARNRAAGERLPREAEQSVWPSPATGGGALFGASGGQARLFTEEEAKAFLTPALLQLREAPIGQIEETGMATTLALEHFVPEFWSPEQAYAIICDALSHTAYDPNGPSDWTADKFLARLDGRRPVPDSWKAQRRVEVTYTAPAPPEPATDDKIEALLAEMLTPEQMAEQEPPAHLIRGLLTLDSESWMVGGPGSKKSFIALDMAAHVSLGREWQGREVKQGNVVFIVAEGAGGSGKRVRAWVRTRGPMGEVRFLARPVQAKDAGAWQVLVEACRRLKPALVVLDTQARVTVGLEENSATEMGIYVERVRAIREATGACVLTIHHTGRKGADARGSSALDGAQSTELTVMVPERSLTGAIKVTKQKDLDEIDDIPLRFKIVDLGQDGRGAPVTSLVLEKKDEWASAAAESTLVLAEDWARNWSGVSEQILTVLVNQGGEIGLTKAETKRNVAELFYGGQVHRGGRGRPEGALVSSTFDTAWTKVLEARAASEDPIVCQSSGQKFVVDPVARGAWTGEHNS
jgi:hypothetical protein